MGRSSEPSFLSVPVSVLGVSGTREQGMNPDPRHSWHTHFPRDCQPVPLHSGQITLVPPSGSGSQVLWRTVIHLPVPRRDGPGWVKGCETFYPWKCGEKNATCSENWAWGKRSGGS